MLVLGKLPGRVTWYLYKGLYMSLSSTTPGDRAIGTIPTAFELDLDVPVQ